MVVKALHVDAHAAFPTVDRSIRIGRDNSDKRQSDLPTMTFDRSKGCSAGTSTLQGVHESAVRIEKVSWMPLMLKVVDSSMKFSDGP